MIRNKVSAAIALSAASALALAGCASTNTSEATSTAGATASSAPVASASSSASSDVSVSASAQGALPLTDEAKSAAYQVIIPVSIPYTEANLKGARDEAAALGLTNVEEVSSDGDPAKMAAQIDDAIAKGVKGIVLNPINSDAAGPAVKKAAEAGICTVIAYSNVLGSPQDQVAPGMKGFVGWDERVAGANLARSVAEKMGGQGNIVVDGGIPANTGQQLRFKAIMDELGNYPNIEVLSVQNSESDPAKGRSIAQNWIQSFGDKINGFIFIDDATGAAGVKVIDSSDLAGKVVVGAFGGNKEFVSLINDGKAYATIPFVPESDYAAALELAAQCVSGDTNPVLSLTPSLAVMEPFAASDFVITSDNASEFTPQW